VVVFVFYDSGPLTFFELRLRDPDFDVQLNHVADIELLASRDDLSPASIRTYVFPRAPNVTDVARLISNLQSSATG
jgi:hypothetical protein